jgi:hypothetical protein
VAAQASPSLGDTALHREEVRGWVGKIPPKEKDELITNLLLDGGHAQIAELLQQFLKKRSVGRGGPVTTGRTVGQLLQPAEDYTGL